MIASNSPLFAIQTLDLSQKFDRFEAVKDLNLNVPTGSFFGFLGPNGAGKSTTIKMLTGLLRPTAGKVLILGQDLQKADVTLKRKMGVVPEKLHLFEQLSALEYLEFSGTMYGVNPASIPQRCHELLSLMDLEAKQHQSLADYSHGMRKKIALAAALIHEPQLLFLDEPFEGLDVVSARTLQHLLKKLTQKGVTVFLTSHILEIVEKLCDHVAMIQNGKLVMTAAMDTLIEAGPLEAQFLDYMGQQATESQLSWLN